MKKVLGKRDGSGLASCMSNNANFRTSKGEFPTQDEFLAACKKVANDYRENGKAILAENAFGPHVTELEKLAYVNRFNFDVADWVEAGLLTTFTSWQRVNEVLTGECIPFLPA